VRSSGIQCQWPGVRATTLQIGKALSIPNIIYTTINANVIMLGVEIRGVPMLLFTDISYTSTIF